VTDQYTPGPSVSNFDPIAEPADIVVMSSATDSFHSDPSRVLGGPELALTCVVLPEAFRMFVLDQSR
jgi:hypothetical protein